MESSIEAAFEALGNAAMQAQQAQGPPPMSPVEMAKHQIEASKVQVAAQKVQVDAQKVQAEQARTQADMAHTALGTALEHQRHATDTMGKHADRHVELLRMQQDAQQRQAEMQQGDVHQQAELQARAQEVAQRPPPGANGSGQ